MKPVITAVLAREEVAVEKRRAPALALRLAVLLRQISSFSNYRPDPTLPIRVEYARALSRAGCNMCAGPLNNLEYDHILPIMLGGRTTVDNLQALCAACHRVKCKIDIRMIAKAKRQKRAAELGRGRKPKGKIKSRGFDKTLKNKFNGKARVCK